MVFLGNRSHRALALKAAMFDALGVQVHLCGTVSL
jgi:hypothetical protein